MKACLMEKRKPASGMLDTHVFIVKEPIEPFYNKQASFLWVPAFQAGCRGFESRLPLPNVHRLFAGWFHARWEQPGSEEVSK